MMRKKARWPQVMPVGVPLPVLLDCVPAMQTGGSDPRFHTTSWSLVLAAVRPTSESREALADLCQTYWKPIYAFTRRNGYTPDQAQDLTQAFFTEFLEKNYVRGADRNRGRFRSFLLSAVKHFLSHQRDRAQAFKRGGGQTHLSIDADAAEIWYAPATVENLTPETLFERRWALSVLERVLEKLRTGFEQTHPAVDFNRLMTFVKNDSGAERYDDWAIETGASAGSLRTTVYRMRKKYRELLRAEIAETVADPDDIEEEIRFLRAVLSD
jgi:RNA polymerase sigma-70 factor (ECF subfamily)